MDPTSRPPVILVVATPARRDRLEQEFANRYARDYDLRVVAGPAEACALVPSWPRGARRSRCWPSTTTSRAARWT